uniref:HDC09507 n=1 Tax=Drosophila melanogaster TaxID=7227 RepID=Q6ILF3_DROME|nr:TPA_inf: HDC09507 [Drosophila melanogaster]
MMYKLLAALVWRTGLKESMETGSSSNIFLTLTSPVAHKDGYRRQLVLASRVLGSEMWDLASEIWHLGVGIGNGQLQEPSSNSSSDGSSISDMPKSPLNCYLRVQRVRWHFGLPFGHSTIRPFDHLAS